jgi:SAM-dependent methyltransferase
MPILFMVKGEFAEPQPDTAPGVHEMVIRLLENEKPGRILDAAAGEGALTKELIQRGFEVEACDLNPQRFKLTSNKCNLVDLNGVLPYPSSSFDFVAAVEVIEHLHDPWHAISEFKRVLKKNGKLIITTPNILSVLSRLQFVFFGEYSYFYNKPLWSEAVDTYQKLDMHINPITFVELEHILSKCNFRLEKIAINKRLRGNSPTLHSSPVIQFLGLISYPFIKLIMKRRFKERPLLSSDELLSGEILILKARMLSP